MRRYIAMEPEYEDPANGIAANRPVLEELSAQILYSRDVGRVELLEHEQNIELAKQLHQAWIHTLETLCCLTHYKTLPFLKNVESYLRQGSDPREILEYDQRYIKEREAAFTNFYSSIETVHKITRRAPFDLMKRQRRYSRRDKEYLQRCFEAIRALPLDRSLWIDFADDLQKEGDIDTTAQTTLNAVQKAYLGIRNRLVQGNLRLVLKVVKKYQLKGMQRTDLIQDGNIGLIRGVEKFDYTKGFALSTYANYWIRQGIRRGLSDRSREVRLPAHVIEDVSRLQKVEHQLREQLDREPTPREVAAKTRFSIEKIERIRTSYHRRSSSLQEPQLGSSQEQDDRTLEDFISDERVQDPLERIRQQQLVREIEIFKDTLSPREAEILTTRFGLGDDKDQTLAKIGRRHHLTRERIRQIEVEMMREMRGSEVLRDLAKKR